MQIIVWSFFNHQPPASVQPEQIPKWVVGSIREREIHSLGLRVLAAETTDLISINEVSFDVNSCYCRGFEVKANITGWDRVASVQSDHMHARCCQWFAANWILFSGARLVVWYIVDNRRFRQLAKLIICVSSGTWSLPFVRMEYAILWSLI